MPFCSAPAHAPSAMSMPEAKCAPKRLCSTTGSLLHKHCAACLVRDLPTSQLEPIAATQQGCISAH